MEDFARKWIKREQEDIDSLSKWVRTARSLILKRMKVLRRTMSIIATSVFNNPETLSTINDKYVVVPADKTQNNIVFCHQNVLHPMIIIRGTRRK